jgi:hypothetical protein
MVSSRQQLSKYHRLLEVDGASGRP